MRKLEQLNHLLQGKWINNHTPTILTVAEAYTRQTPNCRFYTISWWGDLPAGFTRFEFPPNQVLNALNYNVTLKVDREEVVDYPDILEADEYVLMFVDKS